MQHYKASLSQSTCEILVFLLCTEQRPTSFWIQEIGCLIGALANLWIGDRLGRRKTIVLGGCIMIVGAILQATAFGYTQMVVARIVTGLGNGLNVTWQLFQGVPKTSSLLQTSTVPSYHAECSPASKRGSLIMIEGSLITFGVMIS